MKKNYLIIGLNFLLLNLVFSAKAQVVSTIAGNGNTGTPLNSDSALKAPVGKPATVYFRLKDKSFYYTDIENHQIRRVDSTGISTTMAGNLVAGFSGDGGNALSASLNQPRSLVVTKHKEIVFCDHLNHRIRKVDSLGIITTIAGTGYAGFGGDGGQATLAFFNTPRGIVQDTEGNFYICDESNNRIRKIDTLGVVSTIAGSAPGYTGDGGSAAFANLNRPTSLSIDKKNQLYITDANNFCVRKIDSLGIISTIAGDGINYGFGGDGGSPLQARFLYISAVAVSTNGDIVIADAGNNRIRRIRNNVVYTIAGNGQAGFSADGTTATSAQFSVVAGVAMDDANNVYICDQGNRRIRTLDDYNKITVHVNELQADAPQIWWYQQHLYCNTPVAGTIQLVSPAGQVVFTKELSAGDNTLFLPQCRGIISFRFVAADNKTMQGKFIAD